MKFPVNGKLGRVEAENFSMKVLNFYLLLIEGTSNEYWK